MDNGFSISTNKDMVMFNNKKQQFNYLHFQNTKLHEVNAVHLVQQQQNTLE